MGLAAELINIKETPETVGMECARPPEIKTVTNDSTFCGRLVSQGAWACGEIVAKFSGRELAGYQVSVCGRKKAKSNSKNTNNARQIGLIDVFPKHGKKIFQLRHDTHKYLLDGDFNLRDLLHTHFAPVFSEENRENFPAEKYQLLRGAVDDIVKSIVKPEHSKYISQLWLSLMDCIGPLAFYGVLKYVFHGMC
jgi:hypothetical protein